MPLSARDKMKHSLATSAVPASLQVAGADCRRVIGAEYLDEARGQLAYR
jgi:hypothetical protein